MEEMFALIDTLERGYRLALALVEGGADDIAVLDVDLGLAMVMEPREGVLHPVLVITLNNAMPSEMKSREVLG